MSELSFLTEARRLWLCYQCGAEAESEDHLPPKCFFGTPRPADMIWAPACKSCNTGASELDLKARSVIALAAYNLVDVNPDTEMREKAIHLWNDFLKTLRTKRRKQLERIRASISRTVHFDRHTNNYGSYVPVPAAPFQQVMERTVRGFHYLDTGRRIPADYEFEVILHLRKPPKIPIEVAEVLLRHSKHLRRGPMHVRWGTTADDPDAGLWMFTFYGTVFVVVACGPPEYPVEGR